MIVWVVWLVAVVRIESWEMLGCEGSTSWILYNEGFIVHIQVCPSADWRLWVGGTTVSHFFTWASHMRTIICQPETPFTNTLPFWFNQSSSSQRTRRRYNRKCTCIFAVTLLICSFTLYCSWLVQTLDCDVKNVEQEARWSLLLMSPSQSRLSLTGQDNKLQSNIHKQ